MPAATPTMSEVTVHEFIEKPRKLYTLVYPIDFETGTIVLGYKKRGFGVGKYNGYGGKVELGETILEAACRELEEESTLSLSPPTLIPIGILFLESLAPLTLPTTTITTPTPGILQSNNTLPILEIHVYLAPLSTCPGQQPTETEEMRPHKFTYLDLFSPKPNHNQASNLPSIPYSQMWTETSAWLPNVLSKLPPNNVGNSVTTKTPQITTFFLHHALFTGGISPNTGLWDPWENMHRSGLETWEGEGEDARVKWLEDAERGKWIDGKRREGWWIK